MTEESNKLSKELEKLNKQFKEFRDSGRHMIYSASPFKFIIFNFIAGIFHALGTLFGYLVIFGAIVYFASQFNLNDLMSNWVENTLQEVNWDKVVPMPENNLQDLDDLQEQLPQNIDQRKLDQLQRQLNQ